MGSTSDRLGAIERVIQNLQGRYSTFALLTPSWFSPALSLENDKQIVANSLRVLREQRDRANSDEDYFINAWLPIAKAAEDLMNTASGFTADFTVTSYFTDLSSSTLQAVSTSVSDATGELVEHLPNNTSLGFIAIGLIAVAVIMVFK